MSAVTAQKIGDIEILRAVAILMIPFAHMNMLFSWLWMTHTYERLQFWCGVDLFFAISGFVIARSLLPVLQAQTNRVDFWREVKAFWIRRAFRLLPAAWFWVAFVLGMTLIFPPFSNFRAELPNAVSALAQVNNFHLIEWFCFHRSGVGSGILNMYWSLSLEEQFYLLLPVLFFLLRRRLRLFLPIVILAQFFVSRPILSALWFVRTDALAFGVLIALALESPLRQRFDPVFLARSMLLRWLLFLALPIVMMLVATGDYVSFSAGMVALIAALLVWIASFDGDYLAPQGWLRRVLLLIGSRAYAIYLTHYPVYILTQQLWRMAMPAGTVFDERFTLHYLLTALVLTIIFSELSYRLLELPFRAQGRRAAARYLTTQPKE